MMIRFLAACRFLLVAALAVAFLGLAAGSDEPSALLNYGGGIAGQELRTSREL